VPYTSFSEGESRALYLSSRGRFTSYRDQSYSITTSALLDEGGKKALFWDYQLAHTFGELDASVLVENSLFHARNLLREEVLPTGRYPVIFDSDNLKELIQCFSNFFSAKSAMFKLNPWAQRLGETVLNPDLTLTDDARFARAFRINKFDSEGVETKPLALIKDGVLASFLHNSVTARHFGVETTGHAYRAPGGPLGTSGTQFVITGKRADSRPAHYLEVIEMQGLHSGANTITGNFSFGAKGYVWKNGERQGTFGNVTISGNIMELLKRASAVGLELEASTDRSFFSVPLLFADLSVAGR
jgi:PmbA protein